MESPFCMAAAQMCLEASRVTWKWAVPEGYKCAQAALLFCHRTVLILPSPFRSLRLEKGIREICFDLIHKYQFLRCFTWAQYIVIPCINYEIMIFLSFKMWYTGNPRKLKTDKNHMDNSLKLLVINKRNVVSHWGELAEFTFLQNHWRRVSGCTGAKPYMYS